MCKEMHRTVSRSLLVGCVGTLLLSAALHAGPQPLRNEHSGPGMEQGGPERSEKRDPRAQSGAEAADEARIYTARLRHCEGLDGGPRDACVEAAKRRLGQL